MDDETEQFLRSQEGGITLNSELCDSFFFAEPEVPMDSGKVGSGGHATDVEATRVVCSQGGAAGAQHNVSSLFTCVSTLPTIVNMTDCIVYPRSSI